MIAAAPAPTVHIPLPAWVPAVTWLLLIAFVALLLRLGWRRWRRHRPPRVVDSEESIRRWVAWVASRWGWDARNLGLVMVDETTRHRKEWWSNRVLPPTVIIPSAHFWPAPNGLHVEVRTVPGIGLDEITKMAPHLANAWGCVRVDVTQAGAGRLRLRGHLSDPLARPWSIEPAGYPVQGWQLHIGIDDEGQTVLLPLANLSGITVAGVPGTGKTSLQRWWMCQLAPHPAVQIAVLDGKVSDVGDGDYGQLATRCFAGAGDDPAEANAVLAGLWQTMRDRSAWLREHRGTAQFWEAGPSEDCPLVVVIVDESHTYVTAASRKDKEMCESNVWYMTKLAKEGRSRGFVTVFVTQKQTADAIPTAIRDVCQVGISFGVRTMDGAVAALGDDIRRYPDDIAPTNLIGRQWTGVVVMRFPDRAGYHRIRTPYVSEQAATQVIIDTSRQRRHPGPLCAGEPQ